MGGSALASIEDSVNASIQRLEDNIEKRGGRLITATRNNTDITKNNRTEITRKQKEDEIQVYRHFKRLTSDISHEKMWMLLWKGNFKKNTESLQIEAQNNVIMTNYIKARFDKTRQNSRLCVDRDETINHKGAWSKLAQK